MFLVLRDFHRSAEMGVALRYMPEVAGSTLDVVIDIFSVCLILPAAPRLRGLLSL
jgi:hypothetical protein